MNSSHNERAAVAAAAKGAAAAGLAQYLRFALGTESYAAPISAIREIIEVPGFTAVPLMPTFVRGVINLRGAVVPVLDLAARFEMGVTELSRRTCVIVVEVRNDEGGTQILGVLVDGVHEVIEIGTIDIEPAPALGTRIDPNFISGMAKVGGKLLVVLNLARVLATTELSRLVASHAAH